MEKPTQIPVSLPPTAAQVAAIKAAGPGAVVQHVRARGPKGRREIARALGRAGVPASVLRTLGWSSIVGESTGKRKAKAVSPAKVEAEAPKKVRPKAPSEPAQPRE